MKYWRIIPAVPATVSVCDVETVPVAKSVWGNFNKNVFEEKSADNKSVEDNNQEQVKEEKAEEKQLSQAQLLYFRIKVQNKDMYQEETYIMEDISSDEEDEQDELEQVDFEVPKSKAEPIEYEYEEEIEEVVV